MLSALEQTVHDCCTTVSNDPTRLMDVLIDVQDRLGCVSMETMQLISQQLGTELVEIKSVVSFYAFFSERLLGRTVIRVCNDVVDQMQGADAIIETFIEELGIEVGETTADRAFSLDVTPCIGMCDQAPAALVNQTVFTSLTCEGVRTLVARLKSHGDPQQCMTTLGDGNNAHPAVQSMVMNNVRQEGALLFAEREAEAGLRRVLLMEPDDVIAEIKAARLRGRGGAGFPTGMKWEFTRKAQGERIFVICNADEGEPGTFKDRVLLTEKAPMLFEGMTIAGYAIGAREGILYLRGEYRYLRAFLEERLRERRAAQLLGQSILGHERFSFDIRIQLGAGAYICGEESALISSCEGSRGDPKNRPPFPAQKGYLGNPTSVNNVETLCCVARILEIGTFKFRSLGTEQSPGTKLISISGDCRNPGVYEVPYGITIGSCLEIAGADHTQAVLAGGPSGQFIAPEAFDRRLCFEDVPTGGALVVFGRHRDLLDVVLAYMAFFEEESCGYCVPCRVGNQMLKKRLENIVQGKAEPSDLEWLESLSTSVKKTSRCGLGQTSPNPILTTLKHFRSLYKDRIAQRENVMRPSFDLRRALREAEELTGRKSVLHPE